MLQGDFVVRKVKVDISGLIKKGISSLNNGDYAQALHFLKRAVELRPSNRDALYSLADFYKRLGELEPAIDCYTRVITHYPLDTESYVHRAACRLNNGDYINALSDINMAITYEGPTEGILLMRADVFASLCLWDEAIQEYNGLLKKNGELAEALLGRGFCYESKTDFESAIKDYSAGMELLPDDYIFYCRRSICYLRIGKTHNAIIDAEKSVELGDYPETYYCRSLAYATIKETQKALLDVKNTLDLDTESELDLEKHFLNETGFETLHTSPRYKGLLESHFGVEIPGLADETVKSKKD